MNYNYNECGNYIVPYYCKNGICVDIGGNLGSFSLKYKDFFKLIHIYEPQTECCKIINNRLNEKHIKVFKKAVFDQSNSLINLVKHKNNDSGSVSCYDDQIVIQEWNTNDIVDLNVETISIEDVKTIAGGRIDYLKMDCETSEYKILYNHDLSNIKYLGIELHWQMGAENWNNLINYIHKFFFQVTSLNLEYRNDNIEVLFKSLHDCNSCISP